MVLGKEVEYLADDALGEFDVHGHCVMPVLARTIAVRNIKL